MRPVAPPVVYSPVWRDQWNAAKGRVERQRLVNATDWLVWDADRAFKCFHSFHGLWDATATTTLVTCGGVFYTNRTGAGTFTALNAAYGGLRSQTGALLNDLNAFINGDQTGIIYPYAVAQEIHSYFRFRLPNAGDLANNLVQIGFWAGGHYIMIVFDTAVDGNWRFQTNAAGLTSTIIAAADNNWHTIAMILTTASCRCVYDGGTAITHTGNITANALAFEFLNMNRIAAAKYADIQEIRILQDAP